MKLTDETARGLEAGAVLRLLAWIAMHGESETLIRHVHARGLEDAAGPVPNVPEDWSAAGPALEWLNKQHCGEASVAYFGYQNEPEQWHASYLEVPDQGYEIVDAPTPTLAIARAVVLVGLRERPDEMQAAWEVLNV